MIGSLSSMKKLTLIVFVAIGSFAILTFALSGPNIREAAFPNSVFIGHLVGSSKDNAMYFSVRVGKRGSAIAGDVPFGFSYRDQEYLLSRLTPDDVARMEGEISIPDYGDEPNRKRHGFLGWGTQNRIGGVEFEFIDNKLTTFYARWHGSEPSPFSLISHSGSSLTFPFNDEQLVDMLGQPLSIVDQKIK